MLKRILALTLALVMSATGVVFAGAAGGGNSSTTVTTSNSSSTETRTDTVNVGNINLGNLVKGQISNEWHGGYDSYYSYGRIQASASVLSSIAAANGGATATGVNSYIAAAGSGLPSNLELLTANLSSPSAWIYYTGEGGTRFQSPTSLNGYDPASVAHSMYSGRGTVYSDTLTPAGTQSYAISASTGSTESRTDTNVSTSTSDVTAGDFSFGTATNTNIDTESVTINVTTEYNGTGQLNVYEAYASVGISPIVLDLSGTGKLDTQTGNWLPHSGLTSERVAMFDINANDMPMLMEWLGPKNGLLIEPKADGTVDGSCLFGTPGGFENGYEKLGLRDANNDKVITGNELKGLYVWVDRNQNAKADNGEVKSLQELNVTELDLKYTNYKSSFVMNGKRNTMWDWWPTAVNVRKVRVSANIVK